MTTIRPLVLLMALLGAGCPSGGEGDDLPGGAFTSGPDEIMTSAATTTEAAMTDDGADTTTGVGATPSFAEHIQPIFVTRCFGNTCHNIAAPGGTLNLSPDGATDPYEELTTRSHGLSGMPYVTPGDPTLSYMWRKLEGTHDEDDLMNSGGGSPMPIGEPLSDSSLALIEAWINSGAMP